MLDDDASPSSLRKTKQDTVSTISWQESTTVFGQLPPKIGAMSLVRSAVRGNF